MVLPVFSRRAHSRRHKQGLETVIRFSYNLIIKNFFNITEYMGGERMTKYKWTGILN